MYSTFKGGKNFIQKKKKTTNPRADSFVFRLHYQFTFAILWVAAAMVASQEYIDSKGSAIQCMQDKGSAVPGNIMNNFCWIMSTYTMDKHYDGGSRNEDWIHPGVGPLTPEDEKTYHAYYLWVPYMLFFQAACFYVPHWIWKQIEGGLLENIVKGLTEEMSGEARKGKVTQLANYMKDRLANPWDHKVWAIKYYVCEILNFVNICLQIHLTDLFLGRAFSDFGLAAASWSSQEAEYRTDPLIKVFPRMTKCHFNRFGGSGTIEKLDALCVLGMNIINEKVYVFLWFWFMGLAVVTGASLLWRLVPLLVPSTRRWGASSFDTLRDRFDFRLASRGADGQRKRTEDMLGRLTFADWEVVKHMGECMDKDNFTDLINMMADNFDEMEIEEEKVSNDSTLPSKTKLSVTDRLLRKGGKTDD